MNNSTLGYTDIALLALYALTCMGIGLYSSRNQNDEDYMIGNRQLNLWGFLLSVVASYIGGAALVAYSAYVYQFGISAIAVFGGTAAGFLLFVPYALKIRKLSENHKFHTLSDYLYYRFGNRSGAFSAILLFIVYFGMLLNQFIAGSSILSGISGWSYETSLIISSTVISVYLFAGGFRSVVKTDVFQYLVLVVVFILIAVLASGKQWSLAAEAINYKNADMGMSIAFVLFGILIIFQSAEYWQRVYAAKSEKVVRQGLALSALLVVVTGLVITIVGLTAHHFLPGLEARNAFAGGLKLIFPNQFLGVGLILIFAAIMSSADTIIFVLASSIAKDFFGHLPTKKAKSIPLARLTRWLTLLFSILGLLFALVFRDLVQVFVFITGLGFTIIPAVIASFHFKLKEVAVFSSFIAGSIWVLLLIISGNLIPEASIASVGISFITLLLVQIIPVKKTTS